MVPEGEALAAGHLGEQIPLGTGDGDRIQCGPQPNTIPEASAAPDSGKQPPSKEGAAPVSPATFVQLEALDTLLEALQGASIVEEHRILMGTMVEKVQAIKSGLTKACTSLLTVFEVWNAICVK